jgi:hypothetical protein
MGIRKIQRLVFSLVNQAFWTGWLFMASLLSLWQDWLGLDAYLVWAAAHWVVIPWWIWLLPLIGAPVVLFFVVKKFFKALEATDEDL